MSWTRQEPPTTTRRLIADVTAAAVASVLAAPFVAAIDTAITKNASGAQSLLPALRSALWSIRSDPLAYAKGAPFKWLWGLFFATYASANIAETLSVACGVSPTTPVLAASTAGNMSMAMAKDAAFAKMYAVAGAAPSRAPLGMFGCFFVRDLISMAFFFTLPPLLSAELQQRGAGRTVADVSSQFLLPVLVQVPNSPWHLLGLDLYNVPGATLADRWRRIKPELPMTIAARAARIVPPFGVGGVANKKLRAFGHGDL